MTNTNKPWHTNYERIRVRVLSNISEIFAKKNHEYEQRKNAKIFVRAKSIACRPWLGYVCLRDILNRSVNSNLNLIIFAELELEHELKK